MMYLFCLYGVVDLSIKIFAYLLGTSDKQIYQAIFHWFISQNEPVIIEYELLSKLWEIFSVIQPNQYEKLVKLSNTGMITQGFGIASNSLQEIWMVLGVTDQNEKQECEHVLVQALRENLKIFDIQSLVISQWQSNDCGHSVLCLQYAKTDAQKEVLSKSQNNEKDLILKELGERPSMEDLNL